MLESSNSCPPCRTDPVTHLAEHTNAAHSSSTSGCQLKRTMVAGGVPRKTPKAGVSATTWRNVLHPGAPSAAGSPAGVRPSAAGAAPAGAAPPAGAPVAAGGASVAGGRALCPGTSAAELVAAAVASVPGMKRSVSVWQKGWNTFTHKCNLLARHSWACTHPSQPQHARHAQHAAQHGKHSPLMMWTTARPPHTARSASRTAAEPPGAVKYTSVPWRRQLLRLNLSGRSNWTEPWSCGSSMAC